MYQISTRTSCSPQAATNHTIDVYFRIRTPHGTQLQNSPAKYVYIFTWGEQYHEQWFPHADGTRVLSFCCNSCLLCFVDTLLTRTTSYRH